MEDILRENPGSVQEFVAQMYVRNAFDAPPGSKVALQAAKELRLLIDGSDEVGLQGIPVTYVRRLVEDGDGKVTKSLEEHTTVTVAKGDPDEQ